MPIPALAVQENAANDKAKKELMGVVQKIRDALQENDVESAAKYMTKTGLDEFCGDSVLLCLELGQSGSLDDSKLERSFQDLCKKYELNEIDIPEVLIDFESEGELPSPDEMKAIYKSIGDALGERRFQITQEIRKASSEIIELDVLAGDMVKITVDDDVASIEFQEDWGDVDLEVPPMHMQFSKTQQGWQWDGYDMEKMYEVMEGMEGGELESLPLIEDPKLVGETIDGTTVDLEKYRGKIVLIDFWGTWCGPCVQSLPKLKKIYAALNKHGFEIIGVANDDAETLQDFMEAKIQLPWKNIVDDQGEIADQYGIQAFPTTLLINKDGEHIASDLHGPELLDALFEQLELTPNQIEKLRTQMEAAKKSDKTEKADKNEGSSDDGKPRNESPRASEEQLKIGFNAADTDGNGKVVAAELEEYLDARLQESKLPHAKIFSKLDADNNDSISQEEFQKRHEVISSFMGANYFGGMMQPTDPGVNYVPVESPESTVDDAATFGAIFHRYNELRSKQDLKWNKVRIKHVPDSTDEVRASLMNSAATSVKDLVKATVIIAGGGEDFFTGGAVLVSSDGLAVTNYHIAEGFNSKMVAMTSDGKVHRVTELIAGNYDRDIALIRLEGEGFDSVRIADETPAVGSDLIAMHHSENRFYTFDRGYVMRYPRVGKTRWMEVSTNYAPGGSGCGIFNGQNELVGLVSMIQFGDGPSISEGLDGMQNKHRIQDEESFDEGGMLMVKHAVSLSSIHSLWSLPKTKDKPPSTAK